MEKGNDNIRWRQRLADPWFDMLESRNEISNVYDENIENNLLDKITMTYLSIMRELNKRISSLS